MIECPECGSKNLSWSTGPVKLNTVVDGRLTMRDVETRFYLGCEECSETLIHSVSPDEVADALTEMGWRPSSPETAPTPATGYDEAEEMLENLVGSRPILPDVCQLDDCGCSGEAHA